MKNIDIESFLRDNKPKVKDNPTFLLEVEQKMRTVEGIKAEVDRQRSTNNQTLAITLICGLIAGVILMAIAYLYPIETEAIDLNILADLKMLIEPWKKYLMLPIAGCAIALGLISGKRKKDSVEF